MGKVLGGDKGDRGGWLVKTYAKRGIIGAERACRKCGQGMVLDWERMVWRC
jgi:hypothetical protein